MAGSLGLSSALGQQRQVLLYDEGSAGVLRSQNLMADKTGPPSIPRPSMRKRASHPIYPATGNSGGCLVPPKARFGASVFAAV